MSNRPTRESETRAHEKRPSEFVIDFDSNPLASPAGTRREGYDQKWVCVTVRGEPTGKVEDHLRHGYTMVPPERSSSQSLDNRLSRNPLASDHITRKDVVLMEAPKFVTSQIKNHHNKKAHEALIPIRGIVNNGVSDRAQINSF